VFLLDGTLKNITTCEEGTIIFVEKRPDMQVILLFKSMDGIAVVDGTAVSVYADPNNPYWVLCPYVMVKDGGVINYCTLYGSVDDEDDGCSATCAVSSGRNNKLFNSFIWFV
jgi:hypothetical protein